MKLQWNRIHKEHIECVGKENACSKSALYSRWYSNSGRWKSIDHIIKTPKIKASEIHSDKEDPVDDIYDLHLMACSDNSCTKKRIKKRLYLGWSVVNTIKTPHLGIGGNRFIKKTNIREHYEEHLRISKKPFSYSHFSRLLKKFDPKQVIPMETGRRKSLPKT